MRYGFEPWIDAASIERSRVRLQRVERRSGRLRQWHVIALDGTERLAELSSKPRDRRPHGRQHFLLAVHLHLLACHDVTAFGVHGLQREDVVAAEARD